MTRKVARQVVVARWAASLCPKRQRSGDLRLLLQARIRWALCSAALRQLQDAQVTPD